jgi:hypothetical protein
MFCVARLSSVLAAGWKLSLDWVKAQCPTSEAKDVNAKKYETSWQQVRLLASGLSDRHVTIVVWCCFAVCVWVVVLVCVHAEMRGVELENHLQQSTYTRLHIKLCL